MSIKSTSFALMLSLFASYPLTQSDQTLCPSDCNDRSQYLDGSVQKYLLCWKVDWTNNSITFSARVATTGWIGLGFSPTGFMTNSDVVIGWVKSGKAYLTVSCYDVNFAIIYLLICITFTG